MAKNSGKAAAKKEVVKKEKGPKPDYKIPRYNRDDSKEVYAKDIEHARTRLIHAPSKDKWIHYIEYRTLKEEKHNGGIMVVKHNSSVKKITY
jgi:hypothetical protein